MGRYIIYPHITCAISSWIGAIFVSKSTVAFAAEASNRVQACRIACTVVVRRWAFINI